MRIRRSRLTGDFVQVPNATARDGRLSHMARGVLVDILSRPDGWETSSDDMWRRSVEEMGDASPGRRMFRSAFAELKACGYLSQERELLAGGRFGTATVASDLPLSPASLPIVAGGTDVPHAGTSVPPGEMPKTAGHSDVPDAGTSVPPAETGESPAQTDVPHGGTSERPAEMHESPGRTDVPAGGTSDSPAETPVFPGRTDVPHGGAPLPYKTVPKTSFKTDQIWQTDPALDLVIDDGIPEGARPLVDAMTASGLIVRWTFEGNEWFPVLSLIAKCGVSTLVTVARPIYEKYSPERASYFLKAWEKAPRLPPADVERPPLRAVSGYQPYQQPPESARRNDKGF